MCSGCIDRRVWVSLGSEKEESAVFIAQYRENAGIHEVPALNNMCVFLRVTCLNQIEGVFCKELVVSTGSENYGGLRCITEII